MSEQHFHALERAGRTSGFLERGIGDLLCVMEHAQTAALIGEKHGLMQGLDPRVKLCMTVALLFSVGVAQTLTAVCVVFGLVVVLMWVSRIAVWRLCRHVWGSALLFTGTLAAPAIVLVPGEAWVTFPWSHWAISVQGLRSAAFLIGRAEASATCVLLLILSTPWMSVLKALRSVKVPAVAITLLGMTYRYIFVLLQASVELLEARRSRLMAPVRGAARRRMILSVGGALLGRAMQLSGEVHLAMVARGYRGEVFFVDTFAVRRRDWVALLCAVCVPFLILVFRQ